MRRKFIVTFTILVLQCYAKADERPCIPRKNNHDSVMCVCNATYCDTPKELSLNLLEQGYYVKYTSSRSGERLNYSAELISNKTYGFFASLKLEKIYVNPSEVFQIIIGFGGGLTDAAGMNIASLSQASQDKLMRQYFGDEGIGYSLIRIPIGGSDYSPRDYTYDDVYKDENLTHFRLAEEDFKYKLRTIFYLFCEYSSDMAESLFKIQCLKCE